MPDSEKSKKIKLRQLRPDDWHHLETLFSSKGACGGCWCMHWRLPQGGKLWEASKGEPNRVAFRKLVKSGKAQGILAFDGTVPVGWCSFGRRAEFPRTERIKAYRVSDGDIPWSINCFFLARGYRGQGLCHQLAQAAVAAIRHQKGKTVEAYPVTLTRSGSKLPAAFSFTGPEKVFQDLGFSERQRLSPSRPLYRLEL